MLLLARALASAPAKRGVEVREPAIQLGELGCLLIDGDLAQLDVGLRVLRCLGRGFRLAARRARFFERLPGYRVAIGRQILGRR